MRRINPASPSEQDVVVARCDSLENAEATARWVLPIVRDWPEPAWHLWIADATNPAALRAARVNADGEVPDWQPVNYEASGSNDIVCSMLSGRAGLVVLAYHSVASEITRNLDGLVDRMTRFKARDALGKPLHKSFEAFGVTMA
jgi:hypothetical protein